MFSGSSARGFAAAVEISGRAKNEMLSPARKREGTIQARMVSQRLRKTGSACVIDPDTHHPAGDLFLKHRAIVIELIESTEHREKIMDELVIPALKKRLIEMRKNEDLTVLKALPKLGRNDDPALGVELTRIPAGEPGRARLRPLKGLVVRCGIHELRRTPSWSCVVQIGITWDELGINGFSRL